MTAKTQITRLQRSKFMASLAMWGIREVACKDSGISNSAVSRMISEDADFAIEYEEARLSAIGDLAKEVIRRGRDGWKEVVYGKGGPIMIRDEKTGDMVPLQVTKFDSKLATFALSALDPTRFGTYAGMTVPALPEDLQPDPEPRPDEPGPEKPKK